MNESFPISLAVLFLLVNAILAAKRGVISILGAGLSLAGYLAVFFVVFTFLPRIADTYLDFNLPWKGIAITALIAAAIAFVWLRLLMGALLPRLLGPDSKLHFLVDGLPGALVSLLPGIIVVAFLFSCFRIAGTVQELNYVAALGREGIEDMGGKIPAYPQAGRWRESIERLPFAADVLDRIDPFSRRTARNAAAVVLLDQASATKFFFSSQPEMEGLFGDEAFGALDEEPEVGADLENLDLPGLVLQPLLREKAADSQLSPVLKALHLRPVLERFVASLHPAAEPGTKPSSN